MSQTPKTRRPRRWLRFTLRGMFLAVLVAAIALAWLRYVVRQQRDAVEAIVRSGGGVVYVDGSSRGALGVAALEAGPSGPAWLRRLLGDDYFFDVVEVHLSGGATDDTLRVCKDLPELRRVQVTRAPKVTGRGLAHLRDAKSLEGVLLFIVPGVTDADVESFRAARPDVGVSYVEQW
jgi:hypothetical protein